MMRTCHGRSRIALALGTAVLPMLLFVARASAEDDLQDADEAKKWEVHRQKAEDAFAFWSKFLDFRHGPKNDQRFDDTGDPKAKLRQRILCVVRAISWVESRHGTGAGASAASDPMQCGNPNDSWWKELTGQVAKPSRFIGGPDAKNYNANELPAAAALQATFPAPAKLSGLKNAKKGHDDPNFNPTMSYYWAVVYFAHRTNTRQPTPGHAQVYKFDDCTLDRLVNGAVEYNGGGDPKYRQKIEAALKLIGCT
jgi:hypothetical protein